MAFAVCVGTVSSAAAATPPLEPSEDTRSGSLLLHQGRFDAAAVKFHEISVSRPLDPEGPLFESLTAWWRLLDKPKDPGLLKLIGETLQETVRRGEALFGGPEVQRGRILAGTALVLIAQTQAMAKRYFDAGSAARRGHGYLEQALAADPDAADAAFGLGAYKYYAAKLPWIVRTLRFFVAIPGGNEREGLEKLQFAAKNGSFFGSEALLLLAYINSSEEGSDVRRALGYISDARSITPDSPLLAAIEARLLFSLGRLREAEAEARQSLALSEAPPTVAPQIPALARLRLALTMYYTYRPRESLELVRPLLADGSTLPPDYRDTAQALQGRLVSDLSGDGHVNRGPGGPKLVSAAPVPRDAEAAAAVQEIRDGLPEKATEVLASASARSAGDVVIQYHLARAYQAAGRIPEARAALESILQDTAKVPRTLHGWALIHLGSAMQRTGDSAGAAEQFRKAAALRGFVFSRAAEDRLRHLSDQLPPEG